MNDNELMHYGVLGMKWGRRKQRPVPNGGKRRVRATKKISNEPNRTGEKNIYSKVRSYEEKQKAGKRFAKDMILGPGGRTTYNMARSMGYGRARSFAKTVFDINAATFIGAGVGGVVQTGATKMTGDAGVSSGAGIGANYSTQYSIDKAYRNSGRAGSLQQRNMMNEYELRRRR